VHNVGARSGVDEQALGGQIVHVRQYGKGLVQDDSDNTPDKMSGLEACQRGTHDATGVSSPPDLGRYGSSCRAWVAADLAGTEGTSGWGRVSLYMARTRRTSNPLEILNVPVDPLELVREAHLAYRRRARQADFPGEPPHPMQKDHPCGVRNRSRERADASPFIHMTKGSTTGWLRARQRQS
jgi:hypothetical protein